MRTQDNLIRRFNITSKYKGYYLILDAIDIACKKQQESLYITKDIYPLLADKYHLSIQSVEKNIRTIIDKCWYNNRELVQEIAGCKLDYCPTNSEFIDYVAYYLTVIQK